MINRQTTFDKLPAADFDRAKNGMLLLASRGISSIAISLDDLATQLYSELSAMIGSAARHDSTDFALSSHDHDMFVKASYESALDGSNDAVVVAKMTDQTLAQTYDICISSTPMSFYDNFIPHVDTSEVMPKLGQVMMYSFTSESQEKNVLNTNPGLADFSGWVKSGGEYPLQLFQLSDDIAKIFEVENGQVKVPKFNTFCKIKCDIQSGDFGKAHPGYTCIPKHSHQIQLGSNASMNISNVDIDNSSITTGFKVGSNCDSPGSWYLSGKSDKYAKPQKKPNGANALYNYLHNGTNKKSETKKYVSATVTSTANVTADFIQGQFNTGFAGDDDVAYPAHNEVAAYIYLGPSNLQFNGTYKATFKLNNGNPDIVYELSPGDDISIPTGFAKAGYEFNGWKPSPPSKMPATDCVFEAQWKFDNLIVRINPILATISENEVQFENKSYGYIYQKPSSNPPQRGTWKTDFSLIFNNESYIGQSLNGVKGTCNGGYRWEFNNGGRSGILLNYIKPQTQNKNLYTKIKIAPFCCVYVASNNINGFAGAKYSDGNLVMPVLPSKYLQTGWHCLTNGDFFTVTMHIAYNNGKNNISLTKTERVYTQHSGVSGWYAGFPDSNNSASGYTIEFDFANDIINKKITKDAYTTKINFWQSTDGTSNTQHAYVNAVCVYKDTINENSIISDYDVL